MLDIEFEVESLLFSFPPLSSFPVLWRRQPTVFWFCNNSGKFFCFVFPFLFLFPWTYCLFFLWVPSRFYYISLQQFDCLTVVFLVFLLFGVHWAFWILGFSFSLNLGEKWPFKKFLAVQLIYNVMLVSNIQHSECIYIYPLFFRFFSHICYYRVWSSVPYALQ